MPTPKDQRVETYLRKVDLRRLDALADEQDVSRAQLAREFILAGIFASVQDTVDTQLSSDVDGSEAVAEAEGNQALAEVLRKC